jgi:dihydroxyacetone kinase-like protein
MGVHGEPGFARMPADAVDAIVERVLDGILEDGGYRRGERVLVFVNGAGGTSLMELLVATRAVLARLELEGLDPVRPLVGSYVTTQETKGFSVSLCRADDDVVRLWTAPSDAPFFHL